MASKPTTVDYILGQIAPPGSVTARKMFGEYALYADGCVVALVCDDRLFVKITDAGRAFVGECGEAPPYPAAKPCFLIAGDKWEDREWMSELFKITAKNLTRPKKKQAVRKAPR